MFDIIPKNHSNFTIASEFFGKHFGLLFDVGVLAYGYGFSESPLMPFVFINFKKMFI
jgi:hypothetical protein